MARKYDVYGMGNALVDLEVVVDDEFLEKNAIEKGVMTLVEEERQTELMKAIQHAKITRQCGGSAANTVIATAQLGGRSFYSCKVSNDELGRFYMEDLRSNGVDTNLRPDHLEEGITGKCLVMVTDDAERTMNTFLGITTDYSEREMNEIALKNAEYLYMEGYLITSDIARKAMIRSKEIARENSTKVAFTFSDPSMVKYFRPQLNEVIGDGVDLLFCNEDEARLFTGREQMDDVIEDLKKIAKEFAITRGKNGAYIYDGNEIISTPAKVVKAVDTNGAGDMFAGAFLFGITNGYSHDRAARLANLASSRVVCQFGPRLNKLEVERLHHLMEEEENQL